MDTASDNPFRRFTSFWLGLAIFFAFAILFVFLSPLLSGKKDQGVDKAAAARRMEIKKEMLNAQAGVLPVPVESVYGKAGGELLSVAPGAVEDAAQIVPGSPRALALAAVPDVKVDIVQTDPDAPIDPAVFEAGKAQYILCQACHGPDGGGMPGLAPPLANSDWVQGPVENLIRIQLRGLTGPITVSGVDYALPVPMIAQSFQTDEQIAAVLTYVRNSFGNKGSAVTPEQVAAFRGEVGKPPLTVEDLIKPEPAAEKPNDQ
ncbi:MAG: c-type cytochrome [Verrucomicrobia bacterium]|nr:c-type cytochrome [Verrucomicrobiota bacterium]